MKRKIVLGMSAMAFLFAACGGAESTAETTDADSTATETVEVAAEPVVSSYNVDVAGTVINWNNFNGEEVDHAGTVNATGGTFEVTTTGDVMEITGASLTVDMASISEGSEKLEGHLMSPDFFDVATFATTEFVFDRHEGGMIYGSVSIIGKEVAVEAPATVSTDGDGATVEVGEFKLDFSTLEMPFFIEDVKAPAEEQHDPNIGFSATIVGTMAH